MTLVQSEIAALRENIRIQEKTAASSKLSVSARVEVSQFPACRPMMERRACGSIQSL
jgi:hypothetical protein